MLRSVQLAIFLLTFIFYSCNNSNKYPYAIKDFPKKLQPYLTRLVEYGIVVGTHSDFGNLVTDVDLERLGRSEHPILRASAFREMLERKSFNHSDIINAHLDDTALVFIDVGEFGIWDRAVSDDILLEAVWKTQEAKDKTVDQVLTKHNYLRSAYFILERLEPQEKYYPIIKDMATRSRRISYDDYELGFGDIEYALYGLAKFKKKQDVEVIKKKMMRHVWKLSHVSFRLMKEFPDTAYLNVLYDYHHRKFYEFSGNRRDGFTGFKADRADPEDFIEALVVQKNDRSAKLLDTMLTNLSKFTCMPDKENIINEVIMAIWEHPCPAYARLREKIKLKAKEILKRQIIIPVDRSAMPEDTTERLIRWKS
jgi:hypothetical protein